jgi:hypothetical protein
MPEAWDQPANVLPVQEEICQSGLSQLRELRQLREENTKLKAAGGLNRRGKL